MFLLIMGWPSEWTENFYAALCALYLLKMFPFFAESKPLLLFMFLDESRSASNAFFCS